MPANTHTHMVANLCSRAEKNLNLKFHQVTGCNAVQGEGLQMIDLGVVGKPSPGESVKNQRVTHGMRVVGEAGSAGKGVLSGTEHGKQQT